MKFRFLLLHVFIGLGLYAQETPGFQILNYAAKTPEAAAFLKYGEYPVNLSTGVPNISIPLYTIDLKGYQMPITLDYHASGIKVEQEATWVGLGWNLNFGAQIILETHDDVDENNSQIYNMPTQADFDHYTSHPYAFDGGPIVSKELDKSRVKDSYFFSSPTASGRFYFKTATEIVVYPPEAFKVELDGSVFEHSSTGKKFKITDPAGNIYKFGAIETSYRKFSHFDYYKSAWYATSIETANREIINLVYEEGGVVEEHNSSQKVDVTKTVTKCGCTGENTSNHISQIINQGATTYTYTKKIKEISFNGGLSKVVFTRANNRDDVKSGAFTGGVTGQLYDSSRLDRITILHDNPGEEPDFVKGFEFEYTTFNPSGTMDEKRLRLSRIYDLVSGDYHQFIYNTSVALPAKNSMSKDYYGYYNGIINYNLIPPHFLTVPNVTTVGSANRSIIPIKLRLEP